MITYFIKSIIKLKMVSLNKSFIENTLEFQLMLHLNLETVTMIFI